MIIALGDQQHIVRQVLVDHVPGRIVVIGEPAYAQPLALADGVVHQAAVLPEVFALQAVNLPRLRRQVLLQEIAETALPDEADTGGVFFTGGGQLMLRRQAAHLGLGEFAQGKQGLLQFTVANRVQEVALVLVVVQALEQGALASAGAAPRVVASGDIVGAQELGIFQECLELDFPVAEYIRVRGATGAVFRKEMGEHVVPVFGGEIGPVQCDAQTVRHRLGVGEILFRGAVLGAVVLFPVLHEQAFHPVALL